MNIAGGTIPPNVIPTIQRPDMVIVWSTLKQIVILELTVPFEMNIAQAHKTKQDRSEKLTTG